LYAPGEWEGATPIYQGGKVRLYANNRLDSPVEVTPAEIAQKFWADPTAKEKMEAGSMLNRVLLNFLSDIGSFDLSEPRENAAYEQVYWAVREAWPS
jgi:hypothetical protein